MTFTRQLIRAFFGASESDMTPSATTLITVPRRGLSVLFS